MFSGIVEETGLVQKLEKKKNLFILTIKAKKVLRGIKIGDSISVDGICLTATKIGQGTATFDVMKETIDVTTMKYYAPGRQINLERSLKMSSRIGGHFVTGHIDGVGVFKKQVTLPNYVEWQIALSRPLMRYIAPKGSVSIDGVSLTIGEVRENDFSVYLIPHTLDVTTFGIKKEGEKVNIETDILAKYILNDKNRAGIVV